MKRALLVVLLVAVLAGAVWAAYARDITGALRKDAATLTEAVLKAIEYIIDNGMTVNAGTNLDTSALALDASVDGLEASLAAIAADLNELTVAPVLKTPTFLAAVIIGTPGTPAALAADATYFTSATLQAGRALAANASLITIGGNTAYTSQRATELAPGDTWTIEARPGTKLDLNDFLIDGINTDDGVRIMYVAP